MTIYHCMIDLKSDARALAFALALDNWLSLLRAEGKIEGWRLMRRKLNLGGPGCADFLLEIDLRDLAQLDEAFGFLGNAGDEGVKRYDQMRQYIAHVEFGLYRPYPDPAHVERLAVI